MGGIELRRNEVGEANKLIVGAVFGMMRVAQELWRGELENWRAEGKGLYLDKEELSESAGSRRLTGRGIACESTGRCFGGAVGTYLDTYL